MSHAHLRVASEILGHGKISATMDVSTQVPDTLSGKRPRTSTESAPRAHPIATVDVKDRCKKPRSLIAPELLRWWARSDSNR
ncbi:hypothetical protein ACU686_38520 [Yinghuangia aomiensis]